MVFRVNGGIINSQTLTGGMRFFKITDPTPLATTFAWTVSNGTVNLPVSVSGGKSIVAPIISSNMGTQQFVIGPGDFTATLVAGTKLIVSGTGGGINNGEYTVNTSAFIAGNTTVTVVEPVPATLGAGGTLAALITTYFVVGDKRPVPNSAAEIVLREISKQADIILIGMDPGIYGTTAEIHIGVSASAFGWGSDQPPYDVPPADTDEDQLPVSPTNAALEMQAAIQALTPGISTITVYVSVGGIVPNPTAAPVPVSVSLLGVTVEEVSFSLGSLFYYTLA